MCTRTDCGGIFDKLRHLNGIPRLAVDQQLTVWSEGRREGKHPWMSASINNSPVRAANLEDPIADNAAVLQIGFSQALPRKRLHGISPEFCYPHASRVLESFRSSSGESQDR
jgi:hypothetical protein